MSLDSETTDSSGWDDKEDDRTRRVEGPDAEVRARGDAVKGVK